MARKVAATPPQKDNAVVADLTEYEAPKSGAPKVITDYGNGTKREDY